MKRNTKEQLVLRMAALTSLCVLAQAQGVTHRLSVAPGGVEGDNNSDHPRITPDGRYVVYSSLATNLVANDSNDAYDVFRHDRTTGARLRVSVATNGADGTGNSYEASVSDDGDVIEFESDNALAPNHSPAGIDVFIRRVSSATTELVSAGLGGAVPNAPSNSATISGDGRFVVFRSGASNLVAGDTNGASDVFVRDLVNGTTERISVTSAGQQSTSGFSDAGAISRDGRYVLFASTARLVAFDVNSQQDVYLRDRTASTTTWVSRPAGGIQPNASSAQTTISADGAWIGFFSIASNMLPGDTNGVGDSFLYERSSGQLQRVMVGLAGAQANGDVTVTSMSGDGRWLGIETVASNVVANDHNQSFDAVLYDRVSTGVSLLSRSTSGGPGDDTSASVSVADDGLTAVFWSRATDLVSGDNNGASDVFGHERIGASSIAYCTPKLNSLGCTPAISGAGTASVSSLASFDISATNVLSSELGVLFYGFAPADIPFQGGWRCMQTPITRTAPQSSGGNPLPSADCTGVYALDFNAHIRSGVDARLVAGTVVYCQWWSRDPLSASTTGLTSALAFAIQP